MPNHPDIAEFCDSVFSEHHKTITDKLFLLIQNNRELMQAYLILVEKHGKPTLNRAIGRAIKNKYDLTNDTQRAEDPKSTLIRSHQEFE